MVFGSDNKTGRLSMLKPLRSKGHTPLATPKPVNLPSMRSQNAGLDPYVSLVPTGSSTTWGVKSSSSTPQSPSTPNAESRPSSASGPSEQKASQKSWNLPANTAAKKSVASPFSPADFPSPAEVSAKQARADQKRRYTFILPPAVAGTGLSHTQGESSLA